MTPRENKCPVCLAEPGDPCVTGNGKPTDLHLSRVAGYKYGDGRANIRKRKKT